MRGIQLQAYDEVLNSYRSRRAVAEDMWGAALAEQKKEKVMAALTKERGMFELTLLNAEVSRVRIDGRPLCFKNTPSLKLLSKINDPAAFELAVVFRNPTQAFVGEEFLEWLRIMLLKLGQ